MTTLQSLILGLIQGLTEFLPVSSSGQLEIFKALLGVEVEEDLTFTVLVHFATVLSIIVVFRSEMKNLLSGLFKFRWNEETKYVSMILLSMIPVGIVGVFFKDVVEGFFGNLAMVGYALLVTAGLLLFAQYASKIFRNKNEKPINFFNAIVIGLSQAIAVIPGLSRSGTTISTGLLLGVKRDEIAKFSFLMVVIPVLGEALLDIAGGNFIHSGISIVPLAVGFVAAFISGLFACKIMITLVKKGSLLWFVVYCVVAAIVAFLL